METCHIRTHAPEMRSPDAYLHRSAPYRFVACRQKAYSSGKRHEPACPGHAAACRPAVQTLWGNDTLTETAYRIELKPPDITAYRSGNTGIDFVTTFDSGKSGPHVLVNALTHGNELCGAIALDFLFRQGVRPVRGKLTLCFANVAAYQCFDAAVPELQGSLTRTSTGSGLPRFWMALAIRSNWTRARALRPLYDTVDLLLDLHSMQHATPPLVLCGMTERGRRLAQMVRVPKWIVSDSGHASGRRLLDYAGFADAGSPKTALLAECGQHWEHAAAAVAIQITLRFLMATGADRSGIRRSPSGAGTAAGAKRDRDHRCGHHEGFQSCVRGRLCRHGDHRAQRHPDRPRRRHARYERPMTIAY